MSNYYQGARFGVPIIMPSRLNMPNAITMPTMATMPMMPTIPTVPTISNIPTFTPFRSPMTYSPPNNMLSSPSQPPPNEMPSPWFSPAYPFQLIPIPSIVPMPISTTEFKDSNFVPRVIDAPPLTASPPLPPNWDERFNNTLRSFQNFKLFPVNKGTCEFSAISALLHPLVISKVQQIINPSLWTRFVNTRKDMLRSKCNNMKLMSELELNETELMACYQNSINVEQNPNINVPYNDNMALLFHCTKSSENVESILRQGLDERMGNIGGLLGRGLYFTDNPEKSIMYDGCNGRIFIFAVLLGDCFTMNHPVYDLVREPEKKRMEKRNFNDLFFDSIVGQPGQGGDNEYVIYNRYQCCPLYIADYLPGAYTQRTSLNSAAYVMSRKYFPPFSWISEIHYEGPSSEEKQIWPFYAKTIFTKMKGPLRSHTELIKNEDVRSLNEKLKFLNELGFNNRELNIEILRRHKFNLEDTVNSLVR